MQMLSVNAHSEHYYIPGTVHQLTSSADTNLAILVRPREVWDVAWTVYVMWVNRLTQSMLVTCAIHTYAIMSIMGM